MTREDASFDDRLRPRTKRGELVRGEIRLKRRKQAFYARERRQQFRGNLLSAEIPEHSPQFVIFVETDPMIDGKQLVRAVLEKNMTAFAVCVVT